MTILLRRTATAILLACGATCSPQAFALDGSDDSDGSSLNEKLVAALNNHGFTGRIESRLVERLGRPIDPALADLGRLIFFDNLQGLHSDNSCAACHAPTFGMGDTGSIAIGVDNNGIVGPSRTGPRNQRRAPSIINTAFFPKLMWNGRFFAPGGDPFDNSQGFVFPLPEGTQAFPPNDPRFPVLLAAQGHIPSTELTEMAGFTGTAGTISPAFDQFDNGLGQPLPPPDSSGFRNEPIRQAVLARFRSVPAYLELFGDVFNNGQPMPPDELDFSMIGKALAEFEMTMTFADAPLDQFARGQLSAMTAKQKRGALLFFGKAGCVKCHAVSGNSNEMFSDFKNHVIGVPQIAPEFGVGKGNVIFDGPGTDEDFGAQQISGKLKDRYKFRTPSLRNLAVQPAFMHNGCFTSLEDAIEHHLHPILSALTYDPIVAGVDADLALRLGPINPVLAKLDPLLHHPAHLNQSQFHDLVTFIRDGLLDSRALPENLIPLIPAEVPSGLPVSVFEPVGQPSPD